MISELFYSEPRIIHNLTVTGKYPGASLRVSFDILRPSRQDSMNVSIYLPTANYWSYDVSDLRKFNDQTRRRIVTTVLFNINATGEQRMVVYASLLSYNRTGQLSLTACDYGKFCVLLIITNKLSSLTIKRYNACGQMKQSAMSLQPSAKIQYFS